MFIAALDAMGYGQKLGLFSLARVLVESVQTSHGDLRPGGAEASQKKRALNLKLHVGWPLPLPATYLNLGFLFQSSKKDKFNWCGMHRLHVA